MPRYGYSKGGNPLTVFVNLFQTKEERKEKYWLIRSFGYNWYEAQQKRDWRMKTIEDFLRREGKI